MPIKRRVIAGDYLWEVRFLRERIEVIPSERLKFSALLRDYRAHCEARRHTPLLPHILSAVFRREFRPTTTVKTNGETYFPGFGRKDLRL